MTSKNQKDPRRTTKAGFSVDETDKPNYDNLFAKANEREVTKHDSLGVPFVMPKNHANIFAQNGRKTENQYYFYHPDHLGSSSYVSYTDGEIAQHTEYAPYGEVLLDETNRNWNTPWLFNGKELDEESGLYYYGARYYNPKVSNWLSVDPKAEKAPDWSPYRAFFCNPIRYTDPDGQWEKDANGNLVAEKKDNAYSLAKYLNTDSKTAISMLAEQGYTVNKKGILNLKVGDVFQVESTTPAPESREDLGFMGNNVRERAGSEFSKNMFENYWKGEGDVELSGKRFAGILMYAKENNPKAGDPSKIVLNNGDGTFIIPPKNRTGS